MDAGFVTLDASQVPQHTCRSGTAVSATLCARCSWMCEQFAYWYPRWFAGATAAATAGPGTPEGERFLDSARALSDAEVCLSAWWHAAVTCVQLDAAPVTVDRKHWDWLLRKEPAVQLTFDTIDGILGLRGDDVPVRIGELAKDFDDHEALLTHVVLGSMCFDRLGRLTSTHQRIAHQMIMNASRSSIRTPHELLLSARIVGACAAGDQTRWQQLLTRAGRQRMAGTVCQHWAYALATHQHPGHIPELVVLDTGGVPESVLRADADPDTLTVPSQRAAVLAMRLITSIADGDREATRAFAQTLIDNEDLAGQVVQSLMHWYAVYVREMHDSVTTGI